MRPRPTRPRTRPSSAMRGLVAAIWLMAAAPLAAQEFTTLKGHGGPVMGLAVLPGGAVASASFDNSVGLWHGRDPRWLEGTTRRWSRWRRWATAGWSRAATISQ